MKRAVLVACLGLLGCGDDGGGDSTSSSTGAAGSTSEAMGTTSTAGSTTDTPDTTTGVGESSSSEGGDITGADESEGGSDSSGSGAAITFAEIQTDLENMGGVQGAYPSCIDGASCHNNPDRNVVLVANPTPAQLMQNYQNILDAPGVPWVTPLDDTAQMLNEVAIPDDVRARWLEWIVDGAPFE
ncbi:MAG: hypothetical protein AAF799_45155 [Myxococcota bacterium]